MVANLTIKKRSILVTFIITLLYSELGLIWVGRFRIAILYFITYLALAYVIFTSGMLNNFTGMIIMLVLLVVLKVMVVLYACFKAQRPIILSCYNKWYLYVFVPILFTLPGNLFFDYIKQNTYQAVKVSSASNSPSLLVGDHIILKTKDNAWKPKHQQLVVLNRDDDPETDHDESEILFLFRVVGLSGDIVEVKENAVIINSNPVYEPYATREICDFPGCDFGPVTVPEGKMFVLGDNRKKTKDARFWKDPFLPVGKIVGIPLYIYFSRKDFNRIGQVIQDYNDKS